MKTQIEQLLNAALDTLKTQGILPDDIQAAIQITRTKDPKHGDFACNIAMMLAKPAKQAPRKIAEHIIQQIPENDLISNIEIAGPGFINFFVQQSATHDVVKTVLEQTTDYGRSQIGKGKKLLIEFVSANPTGPLHVGHGRGAAYGAVLADLLTAAGYEVDREYYVNDAGRQMDILATSVWLRYLQNNDISLPFPTNGYQGDYVIEIAKELIEEHQNKFIQTVDSILENLPVDEPEGGNKEIYIDALIAKAKSLLNDNYDVIFAKALNTILHDIREDLKDFGIEYQNWFSERSLTSTGKVDETLQQLENSQYTYEKEGALWFKSTDFGDEKDRVIRRDNGLFTYFASDIAYHLNKLERGYDRIIDIWGADHHGYVPRVKAALSALIGDDSKLDVLLVQFANLYRGNEKISMSTRSGSFVTFRELRDEVGNDATRFFYVMRRCEQHMDFDLELAKSQSNDNPVYYVQYAHARICSVFRQLDEQKITHNIENGLAHLNKLAESHEESLLKNIAAYPEILERSAKNEEPHQLTYYTRELANQFHSYYNAHQFLVDDSNLRDARLCLILATRQVLQNVLKIIGISAPQNM